MADWARLEHAYGRAKDVPRLLARAERKDDEDAWDDLWSCLCHQGTVYSASYAALPQLAVIAARRNPAPYLEPLHLAAAIIASDDTPHRVDITEIRRRYATELAELERLAVRCLALPELRDDPTAFIHTLQAVLAFRDEPVWQRRLEELADGEYELLCPSCDSRLYLAMDDQRFYASTDDTTDNTATRTPLVPADPHLLDGVGARLHQIAVDHDQPQVARQLTHLFGQATCPACQTAFPIAEAVADDDALSEEARTQVGFVRDEESNCEVLVIGDEIAEEWIEIQRALEFDDQDVKLGMDTYCLVNSGHATTYGGVKAWHLADGRLQLTLKRTAARTLGLARTVEFPLDAKGEALVRQHLDRLLS